MRFGLSRLMKPLLLAGGAVLTVGLVSSPALARHRHHRSHVTHHSARHREPHGSAHRVSSGPPFSAIVVDAHTGRTIYSDSENEQRHPASLTKVMTLYLLFEQMQAGRITAETMLQVSPHAASMEPDKLGLRPGSHIRVDDAIRAIVTKSANDMAVSVAEAVGGSESHFAELMTSKAHELGMSRTQYVNASGLPDDRQLTTAHDLAILGRAMQERFPQYFHYFSLPSFRYGRAVMPNHDHLLGRVEGVDGIKTGYTRASGYNLLTDVRRGDRHLVAVVLGGKSWRGRDQIMERLIEDHIAEASPGRSMAPISTNVALNSASAASVLPPSKITSDDYAAPAEAPAARPEPPRPAPRAAEATPSDKPRPAVVASAPKAVADETPVTSAIASPSDDGSTHMRLTQTTTPAPLRWMVGPQPVRDASKSERLAKVDLAKVDLAKVDKAPPSKTAPPAAHEDKNKAEAHDESAGPHPVGTQIQIGATDDVDHAKDLLQKAKSRAHKLASAKPYTEKFQKGGETYWRARFAGLDPSEAEAACRQLKRSGFSCFTIKD